MPAEFLPPNVERDDALTQRLREALQSRGPDYEPRTHHRQPDGTPTFVNRLILTGSPYLLQHAHNPVDWYPWSDEAFDRARLEDKCVLLSVGYSTCHWCHVMERESFEDLEIAGFLNERFVAIKVDREERPDIDEVYMTAVQALTGGGGWPMTVLMTPERAPFFAGTYFPPRDGDRGMSRGFLSLLRIIDHEYRTNRGRLTEASHEIARALREATQRPAEDDLPSERVIEDGALWYLNRHDPVLGGFGPAPKFPRPTTLELLQRQTARSGDPRFADAATHTLERMIVGGLRDHVGGGFHRYSVDEQWLIPHFEKMLYDNAQLVVAMVDALPHRPALQAIIRQTLDYLITEMRAPEGGFYSATDADSLNPQTGDSDEGWFFTWTEDELREALDPSLFATAKAWFHTSAEGNFEGRNHLHTPRDAQTVAAELGIEPEALPERIAAITLALYGRRAERPPPLRDDKILAAWNGLTLCAFARAGFALAEPEYLTVAEQLATFLLGDMCDDAGRLLRSQGGGGRGFLDDHAFVIAGLLDLFEARADLRWLQGALALQSTLDEHHRDAKLGSYCTTADDGEALLARQRPDYDGAEPSGNSVTAENLLRLAALTGNDAYRVRADGIFKAQAAAMRRGPMALPKLLSALAFRQADVREVFIIVPPGADRAPMLEPLREAFLPFVVRAVIDESQVDAVAEHLPPLAGKRAVDGQVTAYVCRQGACERPTTDPATLRIQLASSSGA